MGRLTRLSKTPPRTSVAGMKHLRILVAWIAWPGLLAACIATTTLGFAFGVPVLAFNLTYLALAASLLLLERWMPHEPAWTAADGQLGADLMHTLLSNGTIQVLIVFGGIIGLTRLIPHLDHGAGFWPRHWPLPAQVVLGLAVSEFAGYWAHRIAHEWEPLWYFHAIHHSVERLWCINNGRFHFVDALKSVVPGVLILLVAGAPAEVMAWLSAITGYIGIMTHCNIAMRFGWLSYVFNTPELHRWHHSKDLREGNKNYGENIVLWDLLFATYFNENRRPPVDIGIRDAMPSRFRDQVAWPFRKLASRQRLRVYAEMPEVADS